MNWQLFKEEFERAGEDIHVSHFQVDWSEDEWGNLKGSIEGLNQELSHDVEFLVEKFNPWRYDTPTPYHVTWASRDLLKSESTHHSVLVSSAFLAAVAIHYGSE